MKRILIAGDRPEVNGLFQLLMWKPHRQFLKATTVAQCLDLSRRTAPDLIVVDSEIDDLRACHQLLVDLRKNREIAKKPLLLIAEPQKNNSVFKELLDMVDGVLPEPFDPDAVKSTTETYI